MVETTLMENSSKHTMQVTILEGDALQLLFSRSTTPASPSMRSRPFLSKWSNMQSTFHRWWMRRARAWCCFMLSKFVTMDKSFR